MSTTLNISDIALRAGGKLSQSERDLMTQWANECTDPNRAEQLREIIGLVMRKGDATKPVNSVDFSEK